MGHLFVNGSFSMAMLNNQRVYIGLRNLISNWDALAVNQLHGPSMVTLNDTFLCLYMSMKINVYPLVN